MKPQELFNSMQNTSVCDVLRRLNVLGSKKCIKKILFTLSRSDHLTNKQILKPKITPLEKHQFLHVLKGLKQALEIQNKEEYLAITAK